MFKYLLLIPMVVSFFILGCVPAPQPGSTTDPTTKPTPTPTATPTYTPTPSAEWRQEQDDRYVPQGKGASRTVRTGTKN